MSKRGVFIVFEGLDRCGKTTQVERLAQRLQQQGVPHSIRRFPDRTTPTGQLINAYLTKTVTLEDHAVHLLFTANRWELVPTLQTQLASGHHIVCDRYSYSGIAYSAAKANMSFEWCQRVEQDLPQPDRVIFLHKGDLNDLTTRSAYGEERYEVAEFQQAVQTNFEKLWNSDHDLAKRLCRIDAHGSIEEVEERVWDAVKDLF